MEYEHLEQDFISSSTDIGTYLKAKGISPHKYYYWKRKFDEALAENKKLAIEALMQSQSLYAVEREADQMGATPEQRRELRRNKAYPILVTFEKWLYENYKALLPQSRTAKAISYTYSITPKLSRYHLDGRYRIDNNLV